MSAGAFPHWSLRPVPFPLVNTHACRLRVGSTSHTLYRQNFRVIWTVHGVAGDGFLSSSIAGISSMLRLVAESVPGFSSSSTGLGAVSPRTPAAPVSVYGTVSERDERVVSISTTALRLFKPSRITVLSTKLRWSALAPS